MKANIGFYDVKDTLTMVDGLIDFEKKTICTVENIKSKIKKH